MLVSADTFKQVSVTVIVITVAAGIVLALATSIFARKVEPRLRLIARIASAIVLVVGLVIWLGFLTRDTRIFVVTDAAGQLQVRKLVLVSSSTYRARFGPVKLTTHAGKSWVINDSSRDVHVARYRYSQLNIPEFGGRTRLDLGPGEDRLIPGEIKHVGPSDQPPRSVTTSSGGETRWWLTW